MPSVIEEWLAKAEGDFRTAEREWAVTESPNFDAVCFHVQQCIEKLLKALLIKAGKTPPRGHDLVVLADVVGTVLPGWQWPLEELRYLSRAAVAFRYPGESAEREDAAEAMAICIRLRQSLLVRLAAS